MPHPGSIVELALVSSENFKRNSTSDPKDFRTSIAKGNNRITGRRPSEDPILMVSQKPEISNQTNV